MHEGRRGFFKTLYLCRHSDLPQLSHLGEHGIQSRQTQAVQHHPQGNHHARTQQARVYSQGTLRSGHQPLHHPGNRTHESLFFFVQPRKSHQTPTLLLVRYKDSPQRRSHSRVRLGTHLLRFGHQKRRHQPHRQMEQVRDSQTEQRSVRGSLLRDGQTNHPESILSARKTQGSSRQHLEYRKLDPLLQASHGRVRTNRISTGTRYRSQFLRRQTGGKERSLSLSLTHRWDHRITQ
ncbi:hypothetical protein [Cyprinid herpesvirus 2]|nr:hypothetical protein [Cyprinid herpesvirus 2]